MQPTDPGSPASASSQVLAALREARLQLEQAERSRSEPIAIIGTACRMPGDVETPAEFWNLLRSGKDPITEIPADRWDNRRYFDANPDAPGKIIVNGGGFVRLAREFDAEFFGIAPREAMSLEPQQRLLLEVTWEALEDAGLPPETLFGKDVGVFSSVCWNDYGQRLLSRPMAEIDPYMASGIAGCMASGRLSHILGLQGPAMVIDTACSSSLTAIHLASQSLRAGECEIALVGAASQLLSPQIYVNFSRSRMLSPDNRCKTFDAGANGFVRSEGAASIVLKRLSDALAAGDEVRAVVLGSAVNHDGHASGLTVPNGPAQQAVIRRALRNANLKAEEVSFVEAHGTGTSLGDPIEVGALGAVYGKAHTHEQPLLLGSVKSNVGHLEAAAGITSVLKVVLALQHREVPPNLHFNRPSPHIPWGDLPFRVPTEATAWNPIGRRVAGISSFGFSGTNVHLLVAEAPTRELSDARGGLNVRVSTVSAKNVLVLSAKSETALRQLATRYAAFLRETPDVYFSDVCFSAATGRAHFLCRLAIVTGSAVEASAALESIGRGEAHPAGRIERIDRRGLQPATAFSIEPAAASITATGTQPGAAIDPTHAAAQYLQGRAVNWRALYPGEVRRRVSLPHYAFDRKPYWIDAPSVSTGAAPTACRDGHPLLGARIPLAADVTVYESTLSAAAPAFLGEHQIDGRALMPAAGFVEMALAAARARPGSAGPRVLEDIVFCAPCELVPTAPRQLQLSIAPGAVGASLFRISTRDPDAVASEDEWQLCVTGKLQSASLRAQHNWYADIARLRAGGPTIRHTTGAEHYADLDRRGFRFGSSFRGVQQLWREGAYAIGEIVCPPPLDTDAYVLHPALLDACLQVVGAFAREERGAFVPMSVAQLAVVPTNDRVLYSRVSLQEGTSRDSLRADVSVVDSCGNYVAEIRGFALRRLTTAVADIERDLYEIIWRPVPRAPRRAGGRWVIFLDRGGYARSLVGVLGAENCVTIEPGAVDSTDSVRIQELLEKHASVAGASPAFRGIVYAGALDIGSGADGARTTTREDIMTAQAGGTRAVLALAQALSRLARPLGEKLCIITDRAQPAGDGSPSLGGLMQSPLLGLGRVLAKELPGIPCVRIDVDARQRHATELAALIGELEADSLEDEIALRQTERRVARLVRVRASRTTTGAALTDASADASPPDSDELGSPRQLQAIQPGLLDSLTQVPLVRRAPGPDEVEIGVRATGLGFRDVLSALAMYPGPPQPLGVECSGVITAVGDHVRGYRLGDEVFGTAFGCFATHAIAHVDCIVKKPSSLSYEAAAALPSSFVTAHYTLEILGKLRKGQRVLIHAGAGGVGQAAIQIALGVGAIVFATAGTDTKRALLRQQGVHHVFDSRTTDFVAPIRELTRGQGVDCILNCLAEPFLSATFDLLSAEGCFLEIGKRDILDNVTAQRRKPHARYFAVDLGEIGRRDPSMVQPMLLELVARLATQRFVPLPVTTFSASQAAEAFRYMAHARHTGKIVVTAITACEASSADGTQLSPSALTPSSVGHDAGHFEILPDATYLITGGLGGLGLATAAHLASRGARSLFLLSRNAPSESVREQISKIEREGARVNIRICDVAHYDALAAIFAEIAGEHPPLRGVIHAAGQLDDSVLLQQTWSRFESVLASKVAGTWNLHRLTAALSLDWFIVFGAGAAVFGERGQANYAAANAFVDMWAHWRRTLRLPATSIDWGPWSEAGMAVRQNVLRTFAERGVLGLRSSEALAALERAASHTRAQTVVIRMDWQRFLARAEHVAPLFDAFATVQPVTSGTSQVTPKVSATLVAELAGTPAALRPQVLLRFVSEQIRIAIGLPAGQPIDPQQPLQELGLDSLMAVELRNGIAAATGCTLPATFAFDYPVPHVLADRIGEMLGAGPELVPTEARPVTNALVVAASAEGATPEKTIVDLTEEEANELLLRELEQLRTGS